MSTNCRGIHSGDMFSRVWRDPDVTLCVTWFGEWHVPFVNCRGIRGAFRNSPGMPNVLPPQPPVPLPPTLSCFCSLVALWQMTNDSHMITSHQRLTHDHINHMRNLHVMTLQQRTVHMITSHQTLTHERLIDEAHLSHISQRLTHDHMRVSHINTSNPAHARDQI